MLFSACRVGEAQLPKKPPRKVLPPSRGIRLMRGAPLPASAEAAAVSMTISCVPLRFGSKLVSAPLPDELVAGTPSRDEAFNAHLFDRHLLGDTKK